MKKIKVTIAFVLVAIMSVVIFTACSHSPEGDDGTPENTVKHYEIELTKNNFEEFLEFSVRSVLINTSTYERDNFCEMKGVLSYAYYKDVKITFAVEYTNSGDIGDQKIYKGTFVAKLNAAGNCSFYTKDEAVLNTVNHGTVTTLANKSITISSVSGVVIFDI